MWGSQMVLKCTFKNRIAFLGIKSGLEVDRRDEKVLTAPPVKTYAPSQIAFHFDILTTFKATVCFPGIHCTRPPRDLAFRKVS